MNTSRIIILILGIIGMGACAYVPPGATVTTPSAPKPVHTVWGDSLSWQATGYPSAQDFELYGRYWHVRPGKSLADLYPEIIEDLGRRPDFMTLALGTNDAGHWDGRDGWTTQDEASWASVIANRGDTKITIVLPWVQTGTAATQADVESIVRARNFLSNLSGVSIIDWWAYVSYDTLDAGGIHVSSGNEQLRYDVTVAMDPL